MTFWSTQEVSFLRDNAGKLSSTQIAAQLGRSPCSIRNKAKELKLTFQKKPFLRNTGLPWGASDVQYILKYATEITVAKLANHLRRPTKEIKEKCRELKVDYVKSPYELTWSDEDVVHLIKLRSKNVSAPLIAKQIGRSQSAVYRKLRQLGLNSYKKENYKNWTEEELKQLKVLKLKHSVKEVAKRFNRTPQSVRAQIGRMGISARTENIGLKNLRIIFSEEPFVACMSDVFTQWVARGLTVTEGGGRKETNISALKVFFKKYPDTLDVYGLQEATIIELEINLDSWPEPPNFKLLKCSGYHPKRKTIAHPPRSSMFGLYDKFCACHYCHSLLKKDAVVGYSNEWEEPKPFPYTLMYCNGSKARKSRKHTPIYQLCAGDSTANSCRICEKGLFDYKKIFLEKKPEFKDIQMPWGRVAWKNFSTLSYDALRYKANLIFIRL